MNSASDQLSDGERNTADARWASPTPQKLLRGPIMVGYIVVGLFFGGLGAWAALANIASAVVASGVVSPEGNRKTIQHLEGGIIAEILVSDGDEVEAGDPLMMLQRTQARSIFGVLDGERQFHAAKLARLLGEQTGKQDISFPQWLLEAEQEDPRLRELLTAQRDRFLTRREVHHGRKAIGRKRIDELQEEVSGWKAQTVSQRKQLRLFDEEIVMKGHLLKKGMLPRPEYLELQRMQASIEGDIAESTAAMARAKQSIGELELQVLNED